MAGRQALAWARHAVQFSVALGTAGAFEACVGRIGSTASDLQVPSAAAAGAAGGSSAGSSGASSGASMGLATGPGTDAEAVEGGSAEAAGSAPSCTANASFAPARLTLITDLQYRNVVHDAFGIVIPPTFVITSVASSSGTFSYNENAEIEATTLAAYLRAADEVAALLPAPAPCTAGALDATCMEQFLRTRLSLAWRRPLTDAEVAGLLSIFTGAAADGAARQVELTLEAALVHPAFLYRSELGAAATSAAPTPAGKVPLTPFELASAVSFALLDSSPDAELWSKAEDSSLTEPSTLAAEVARLLELPTVRASLMKKVSYYLDFEALPFVSKDPVAYPGFASLQGALYQSSQMFLSDILWSGTLSDLFTSRRVYANAALAAAYGLPPVAGTDLQPVTTTGDAYSGGLLTQPALLAASNKNAVGDDVIHRGLWVYYNLLCAPVLPPPPANASAVAATFTGSTREQAVQRDTTCGVGCHGRFDPFGLVTLAYDGIGRYRTTDPTTTPAGGPIDDSATIFPGILDGFTGSVTVSGAADVAGLFAHGRQVSDCAADNLATYLLQHSPDVEGACDLQGVKDRFAASGSFVDLFTSILTSPAFRTRDF